MLASAPVPIESPGVDIEGSPLASDQRRWVLSSVGLKRTLAIVVVATLLVLWGLVNWGISRSFDWYAPRIRHDLQHKAQHGARELAQAAQLATLTRDPRAIAAVGGAYAQDPDVVWLALLDPRGRPLFEHGKRDPAVDDLFERAGGAAHDLGSMYAAWVPAHIQAIDVGRAVLLVSKARLELGAQLHREIQAAAACACFLMLALWLSCVQLYIGPRLRGAAQVLAGLERAVEAAQHSARLKSQLLASMNYEIRTPMQSIVGTIDLLTRSMSTAIQQRHLQTLENSARSLLCVIDDSRAVDGPAAGKYALREADFELQPMVQDVTELLAPKAHAKGIELVQRVDPDLPYSVHADVDRIRQAITNLIGNAIEFTERGHVVLRVSADARGKDAAHELVLRFSVQDTGIGIAAEDRVGLFEDASLARKRAGTGLGLTIAKRLAETMGGTVGVESELAKGSTLWFTIATRKGRLEPCVPMAGVQPRDARILVVVEDEALRAELCELAARWGMRCAATHSAEHACALILDSQAHAFDVAVIDGCFHESESASGVLFDLCAAEALPLIRLLSTTQTSRERDASARQLWLLKPVRESELYSGLVSLLDGVPLEQQRTRNARPGPSAASARRQATVLLVDDNEINRVVTHELLIDLGFATDVARSGAEAVEKAGSGGYSAILMDCQMPGIDGYEATRLIRALPGAAAKVPIIALTAHATTGDRDRALQAGMDDYAAKPIRSHGFERVLARWLPSVAAAPQTRSKPSPEPSAPRGWALDPEVSRSVRLIDLFLRAAPEQLAALELAVQARELERVKQLAHKFKGSCRSLGAGQLAESAHAVERAAVQGAIDASAMAELAAGLAVVCELLQQTRGDGRAAGIGG